jgi:hypothetical protein
MTEPEQPDTTTLATTSVLRLANLLCELDEFLRSSRLAATALAGFLHDRGDQHPGFAACNLIDELCFTAAHFRRLANSIDPELQQQ